MARLQLIIVTLLLKLAKIHGAVDSKIDPHLLQAFQEGGPQSKQSVIIYFHENIQTVIDNINAQTFPSIVEKRVGLTKAQQELTNKSQENTKLLLDSLGVKYLSFWIANVMVIKEADLQLVHAIVEIPNVIRIEKEGVHKFDIPRSTQDNHQTPIHNISRHISGDLAWGVQKIRADKAWRWATGRGVVVAHIDTGVRATHEALKENWRQNYGWYDASEARKKQPTDTHGHGTHVMGTIAGKGGIGVAPEANWIACRVSDTGSKWSDSAILSCGSWVQCPTRPDGSGQDCSYAPRIVSNSWSTEGGNPAWFDSVINSWTSAGIIPVFSIGNSGPGCGTIQNPGGRKGVIAVGSTNQDDSVARYSGRGPTSDNRIKPDVMAPGQNIPSASHLRDNEYRYLSGASMATPHVAGVIALILQKYPNLQFNQVDYILSNDSERYRNDNNRTCSNKANNVYPNNVYGWGRVDALKAVTPSSN